MKNNEAIKLANLRMLQFVATKLGKLCNDVVFLGGCTTAIFITDLTSPDVRYTLDVDCIVDIISLHQYHQLERQLHEHGFKKSPLDEVICRWHYDDAILDVMPTDEKILGFGNRWYKTAIQQAVTYLLTDKLPIKIVTAPYFLATKLEAFKGRGKLDFFASHDFEDIVSVLDGRVEIIDEVRRSDNQLRNYLAKSFTDIHNNRFFHDALPGHFVQYGSVADERITFFLQKIEQIKQCN